jgi:hypothetical protein
LSDIAQGPGWWLASDGKWYPPRDESQAPAPGWWLASDGKWYPPMESEDPPEPDWWLASDGKWYPPDRKPGSRPAPSVPPTPQSAPPATTTPSTQASAPPSTSPPEASTSPPQPEASPHAQGQPEPTQPAEPAPPAPQTSNASAATTRPTTPPASAVKPIPAAGSRTSNRPVKPIPAGRERPVKPKPATTPAPPPLTPPPGQPAPAASPRPAAPSPPRPTEPQRPAEPARPSEPARPAASSAPAAPPKAPPPAPPAAKLPMAPVTRPSRSSDLDGHDANGLSPLDQMRARDEQSKKDAAVLADARRQAAMRALGSLGVLANEAPAPSARPKPPPPAAAATVSRPRADEAQASGPLVQMFTDSDRAGERVTVFRDRVELHNRGGLVRRVPMAKVTDVAINKRFTGTTLTIQTTTTPLVVKGLKPDQADELRNRLLEVQRASRPAPPAPPAPLPTADAAPDQAAASSETGEAAAPTVEATRNGVPDAASITAPTAEPEAPEAAPKPEATAALAEAPPASSQADQADAPVHLEIDAENAIEGELVASDRSDEAATEAGAAGPPGSEVQVDTQDLLDKLAALRDAGVLTGDEYDAKAEIVAQLGRGEHLAVTAPTA